MTLPERPEGTIRLRLRAPLGHTLHSARAGSEELSIDGDCVVLPAGRAGRLHIVTDWVRHDL